MEVERFRKHIKNRHHKSTNIWHKCASKGGSPKVIFLLFLRSPSQDELQGAPRQATRPKSMLKLRPWDGISCILLQFRYTRWRHFEEVSCIPSTTYLIILDALI